MPPPLPYGKIAELQQQLAAGHILELLFKRVSDLSTLSAGSLSLYQHEPFQQLPDPLSIVQRLFPIKLNTKIPSIDRLTLYFPYLKV